MADLKNLDPELAAAVTMLPQLGFDDLEGARTGFNAWCKPCWTVSTEPASR